MTPSLFTEAQLDPLNQPVQSEPDPVQQAIDAAADAAGDEWVEYAIGFVRDFLQTHRTLHVDELWAAGLNEPTSKRALGRVMQHAAREQWMRKKTFGTDVVARPSTASNGQLKAVWESLICR